MISSIVETCNSIELFALNKMFSSIAIQREEFYLSSILI